MSFIFPLFYFVQSLPKETKEEIITSINKEPFISSGSASKNANIIYQWLKENDYQPPNEDYSLEHVKDFITEKLFGDYFPERIPQQQDDEEELKQLEIMREAIDKVYRNSHIE